MKFRTLSILAALPLLVISCKEKTAPAAKEISSSAPVAPPADAPVILAKRGHLPPAGTKAEMDASMNMDGATMHIEAGGQQMEGIADQSMKAKEKLEFLPEGKIRRTIVTKKNSGKMKINGMDQPTPESADPLEGKPVLIAKQDGKWTASLEDGSSPSPEQLPAIESMAKPFNNETDVETYGEAPRKVGEKWNVDPSKIGSFADAENLTGTYAIEFLRVEDYQGTPCAVLKADVDIKGKTAAKGGVSMDVRIRGEVTSYRSLKDLTDLQMKTDGTINIDGAPAPGMSIHIEGPFKVSQKVVVTAP